MKNKSHLILSFLLLTIFPLFAVLNNLGCHRLPKGYNVNIKPFKQSSDFINMVKNFEILDFNQNDLDSEQVQLIDVIKHLLSHQLQESSLLIKKILFMDPNHIYSVYLTRLLIYILFEESNWIELARYSFSNSFKDPDSVFLLARVFSTAPKDSTFFTSNRDSILFEFSPSGTPIVPIKINGITRFFWFDTGTNYTIISSDIAEECSVSPFAKGKTKAISASNYKIDALPAIIKEFQLGNIHFINHPALIVDSTYLKLRLFGGNRITKIDGIIGWKAIQNARFTINPKTRFLIIANPKLYQKENITKEKNFFWLGFPIVIAYLFQKPLLFVLDLGSDQSYLTVGIFNKIDFSNYYKKTKLQGSVGGWRYLPTAVVPYLKIRISKSEIEFFNIHTSEIKKNCFFNIDGFLGADILRHSSITFDVQNSFFSIQK